MALKDKASSNVDGSLSAPNDKCSFSHKAGLKEGGRGEIERGRKREGFPRH